MRNFLFITFLLMVGGCSGKHPSRAVQLCLEDERGVDDFKHVMQTVAHEKGMEFVDGSTSTARKLKAMNQHPEYELIHIGISGKDDVGLTAGNQGLSAYEVAIGFSAGSSNADEQKFERAVIQALAQRWQVHEVPAGQGAFPLKACSQSKQRAFDQSDQSDGGN